jgi:hypothetical protein
MDPVIVEGDVRTVEAVSSRVVSNKTVVQRTTNTESVHVNKYDADGNLKSSDVDTQSWEERDTKSYEWSKPADQPPSDKQLDEKAAAVEGGSVAETTGTVALPGPAALAAPGQELSVETLLASEPATSASGGATLVMTTTDFVPGVTWSGTTVQQSESTVVSSPMSTTSTVAAIVTSTSPPTTVTAAALNGEPPSASTSTTTTVGSSDVQTSQRTTVNVSGESWSRSGEVVWINETPTPRDGGAKSTATPTAVPAIENGVPATAGGGPGQLQPVAVVVEQQASTQTPASQSTPTPTQPFATAAAHAPTATSPMAKQQPTIASPISSTPGSGAAQPLSVEERRQKRCAEARVRREAALAAAAGTTTIVMGITSGQAV